MRCGNDKTILAPHYCTNELQTVHCNWSLIIQDNPSIVAVYIRKNVNNKKVHFQEVKLSSTIAQLT